MSVAPLAGDQVWGHRARLAVIPAPFGPPVLYGLAGERFPALAEPRVLAEPPEEDGPPVD